MDRLLIGSAPSPAIDYAGRRRTLRKSKQRGDSRTKAVLLDFGQVFRATASVTPRQGRFFEEHMMGEQPEAKVKPEKIPAMQQLLDNPFLLLFIGVTIPTVLYVVWGVMEIASIPIAP